MGKAAITESDTGVASAAKDSCREHLQLLRARHRERGGSDDALCSAAAKLSRTKSARAGRPPVKPKRSTACCGYCPCVTRDRVLLVFAILFSLYVFWGSNEKVQLKVRIMLGKYSYYYILRPLRFTTVPILKAFPETTKRLFQESQCVVHNPYYKHKEPPLSDLVEESDKPANCACRGMRSTDIRFLPASEAISDDLLSTGTVPSVLTDRGTILSAEEFTRWYLENAAIVNSSTCLTITHTGEDGIDYTMPPDMASELATVGQRDDFFGLSSLLCPGSAAGMALQNMLQPLREAERYGLQLSDLSVWLAVAIRGVKERRIARATPYDMATANGVNLLMRLTLLVGQTRARFTPVNCAKCIPVETDLEPGQSVVYNTSVWMHDQVIVNYHPTLSVTVATNYVWPPTDDEWVKEYDEGLGAG